MNLHIKKQKRKFQNLNQIIVKRNTLKLLKELNLIFKKEIFFKSFPLKDLNQNIISMQ